MGGARRANDCDPSERPPHRRERRKILDVRQIEFHGSVQEASLERLYVPASQMARHGDCSSRARDGERKDCHALLSRKKQEDQLHGSAADGVSEPVECHVDDRLDGALLSRWNRRVKQLVAGAKEGAAQHRFAAARDREALDARRQKPAETSSDHGERWCGRRHRQTEPLEREPARRRLKDERDQAGRRIVNGKKAQKAVAADYAPGFGFEHVVQQRGARRSEQHQHRQHAKVRRRSEHPKACSGCRWFKGRHRGSAPRSNDAGIGRMRKPANGPRATKVQRCEHRQHRAHPEYRRDLVRHPAAKKAAEGPRTLNLPEPPFRRSRIEPIGGDEPERRAEHRAQS